MSEPASSSFAFKAKEIEELADVHFFRPVGMLFAVAARTLRLTPTAVTLIGTAVGVAGGALLAWPGRAYVGFLLLILHGVLDSSDGQLARMTGRSSDFGRMMDGVGGYVTHVAIYAGIITFAIAQDGAVTVVAALAAAAGVSSILHAQMYDYHRTTYIAIAVDGRSTAPMAGRASPWPLGWYERMQRTLAGLHPAVERRIAARLIDGRVREDDRSRYRSCFYWPVRGWNLLGDNTRFYAIGVFAWALHVDWFLYFELVPMNVALAALWWWQRGADRRFLAAV